jgi:hypothetical protein
VAIAGTMGVAAGMITPLVALALIAFLKLGKEVYCKRSR